MMKKYYDSAMDNGMVKSDWSKPAGLPQEVINKDWAPCDWGLNDQSVPMLFKGVNDQINKTGSSARKERSHRKY